MADRTEVGGLVSRLDLGWTLEYLAWWPDTFRGSFRILFLLALDKGTPYTDQSSRHLATLFQLHLGGTSVPFGERLDALEELVNDEDSDAARILAIDCLGAALTSSEL